MNPRTWSAPLLTAVGLCAATIYLLLFAIAVSPSARVEEQRRLGASRDSEIVRAHPLSFFRYYATVHGNAYLYFEIGQRFAGIPPPPPTDPVAAKLARMNDHPPPYGERRLPYRDFASVYPPLAAVYFAALSSVTRTFDEFFGLLRLANLAAMLAIMWLGRRSIEMVTGESPKRYWAMATLLAAAIGPRYLSYYDAVPALCLTLALHEALARRWSMAGAAIAAGAWLKVFAVFLGPLFLIGAWRTARWHATAQLAAGAIVASVLVLSPWLLAGDSHYLSALFQQGGRKYFEYGSLVGSTMVILRQLGLTDFSYASELDSLVVVSPLSAAAARVALPAIVIGVLFVAALAARFEARTGAVWLLACSATVGVVLMGAPVYSPQYNLIWFGVLVVSTFLAPRLWPLATAYCLVTQIQHPLVEGLPDDGLREAGRAAIFAIRNVLFAAMAWTLWREMRAHRSL